MNKQELYSAALGLSLPWYVSGSEYSLIKNSLDIDIDFKRGSEFPCSCCGNLAKAYDTKKQSWRHVDSFSHYTYLHARVPRIDCFEGCGIKQIDVPWARSGSGFTFFFETLILSYCKAMSVSKISELVGEHDTRLWRVIRHYLDVDES